MLYLIIGVLIGIALSASVFCLWLSKAESGELQIYTQDGEIYPVLSVKSKKDFEKKIFIVRTRYANSQK